MAGTWFNVIAILVGTALGLLLKRGIPQATNTAILRVEGVTICMIGLTGMLKSMIWVENGRLQESGSILLLISLVLGCLVGERLRIEDRLNDFGVYVESRFQINDFAKGFVAASLIFPIGAMALLGALYDGLGDSSVLIAKGMLDGITAVVLASTLGVGVAFAAIPVLLLQGSVSLLAVQLEPFLTNALLDPFCMVGYSIVLCIGLNFLLDAKIKVANLLPALLVPIGYYILTLFVPAL
jgi:Uncharacterized membrane protein, possible Na+ channel or pump